VRAVFVLGMLLAWACDVQSAAAPKTPDGSHRGYEGQHIVGLWPQPVAGEATVMVHSTNVAEGYFELYTLRGRRVARSSIQFFDAEDRAYTWSPSVKLVPGVYILRLTASDHSLSGWKWIQR
jgi:hypothetical protein